MRSLLVPATVVLSLAILPFACTPTGTGDDPDTDGGVDVLDGGGEGEGEGEGEVGEGEGEGEDLDGGFGFDASVSVGIYDGGPEPGVRCGDTLASCGAGNICCAELVFQGFTSASIESTCGPTDGGACAGDEYSLRCDGDEDCPAAVDGGAATQCCLRFEANVQTFTFDLETECAATSDCVDEVDAGDKQGSHVCRTSADCLSGEVCCGVKDSNIEFQFDMGACGDTCE
jgi:hypothetical protein